MPLRSVLSLLAVLAISCGGARPGDEPTTAKEKQRREARSDDAPQGAKKWGGWRYKGERKECFYSLSGHCFKTEEAACAVAKCAGKKPKCFSTGGGPAIVSCR